MIIILGMISCESPSAKSHKLASETIAVVVVDSEPQKYPVNGTNVSANVYKVKRLDNNGIHYVSSNFKYEANDTLYVNKQRLLN